MRLLYVSPRYGLEVAGGAELQCRQFATRLAERGHDVHVVTTCATNYVDWADVYEPGVSELDGVTVHRLRVRAPREDRTFGPLNARVPWGTKPMPLYLQEEWMRMQGPDVGGFADWLETNALDFDVVSCVPYLYDTTWVALRTLAGRVPTLLHPATHDEPPLYLPLFDIMFRLASAFAFFTEEERDLVAKRFDLSVPSSIVGIGADLDRTGDPAAFRAKFGVGDDPYLLFVGRLDPGKGSLELYDFFAAYKERNPSPLKLVFLGDPVRPVDPHPDMTVTGFVADQVKDDAMAGCLGLVQPSFFESFSRVLTEAWAHRRPALVQGRCEVLRGQCMRSGGGIPYWGFPEFEAALDLLVEHPKLRDELGRRGRHYVEDRYDWEHVLDGYEHLLVETASLAGRPLRR
ncbi:MAG: glycosyltransferase family 4 protein [Acidimicrobiales bacterium]